MKNEKSVNNVTIVILSLAKAKYRRIANNLEFYLHFDMSGIFRTTQCDKT